MTVGEDRAPTPPYPVPVMNIDDRPQQVTGAVSLLPQIVHHFVGFFLKSKGQNRMLISKRNLYNASCMKMFTASK